MPALVVDLHDVSPLTQQASIKILQELSDLGVRQTSLLVIPNHHGRAPVSENPQFQDWLRRQVETGHEAVLHGYLHQRPRAKRESLRTRFSTQIYTAGEGEFFDLALEEAADKLAQGLSALSFLECEIAGFIAPAWLLGSFSKEAVRRAGFRYTATVNEIEIFGKGCVASRSLVWSSRSRWRQILSLAWNQVLSKALKTRDPLRIAIHPPDYGVSEIWEQIRTLIRSALRTREAISYQTFIQRK